MDRGAWWASPWGHKASGMTEQLNNKPTGSEFGMKPEDLHFCFSWPGDVHFENCCPVF